MFAALLTAWLGVASPMTNADVLHVPAEFATIQSAIDAAVGRAFAEPDGRSW